MQYTKHAYKRLQERGLMPYHREIHKIVRNVESMLTKKGILLRVGNIAVVAAKDEQPKIITVWPTK